MPPALLLYREKNLEKAIKEAKVKARRCSSCAAWQNLAAIPASVLGVCATHVEI
jgi:hypothetical protein